MLKCPSNNAFRREYEEKTPLLLLFISVQRFTSTSFVTTSFGHATISIAIRYLASFGFTSHCFFLHLLARIKVFLSVKNYFVLHRFKLNLVGNKEWNQIDTKSLLLPLRPRLRKFKQHRFSCEASLVMMGVGNHLIESTFLEKKAHSPVPIFCYARTRICNTVCGIKLRKL